MTIKILADADRLPMTDVNDIRSFKAGEVHDLTAEHEQHLIDIGVAEPFETPNQAEGHAPVLDQAAAEQTVNQPDAVETVAAE